MSCLLVIQIQIQAIYIVLMRLALSLTVQALILSSIQYLYYETPYANWLLFFLPLMSVLVRIQRGENDHWLSIIKRWSEAESFTIFENHDYIH